jgi:hypothetical protein
MKIQFPTRAIEGLTSLQWPAKSEDIGGVLSLAVCTLSPQSYALHLILVRYGNALNKPATHQYVTHPASTPRRDLAFQGLCRIRQSYSLNQRSSDMFPFWTIGAIGNHSLP